MFIYFVLILLIMLSAAICFERGNTRRARRRFCNITIILFLLVQCLRSFSVGEDTVAYVEWFKEYCEIDTVTSLYHPWRDIDLGYSILNILLSRITDNPRVLLCIVSAIIVILHVKFIQYHVKDVFLGVMLFMGLNFFLTSMVSWRQFIALGIIIWMYPALQKKRYLKAFLILALGCLFHDTAILFGIIIIVGSLFSKHRIGGFVVLVIGFAVILLLPIVNKLVLRLLPAYSSYFDSPSSRGSIGKLRIVYMIMDLALILLLYNSKKYRARSYSLLSILIATSFVSGLLSLFIPYIFRLGYYFDYFTVVLVPDVAVKAKDRKKAVFFVTACCLALYIYYVFNNPGQTVPYKFFFA